MLPPQMAPGPAHAGPGVVPQGNPGNAAAALLKVRNAVQLLEEALPIIPLASPLHQKVMKVAGELAKELAAGNENKALELQSLVAALRTAQQQQPVAALSRMFPPHPVTQAAPQPPASA